MGLHNHTSIQGAGSGRELFQLTVTVDFYYKGKDWRAHRLSFLLTTGKEPAAVLHKCNNPACVRPSHLQAGDSKENLLDILIDRIYEDRDVA